MPAEHLQIIWTPWRNHSELLNVREWFYAPSASYEPTDPKSRRKACDQVSTSMHHTHQPQPIILKTISQVSAWKLRGNLPHAIESTWLLTEAILIDEVQKPVEQIPIFAIKASYIAALTRYVLLPSLHSPQSPACTPYQIILSSSSSSSLTHPPAS